MIESLGRLFALMWIVLIVGAVSYVGFQYQISKSLPVVASAVPFENLNASQIVPFMKERGCSGLYIWYDGTLKCSHQDCKADGYCKYVYDEIV